MSNQGTMHRAMRRRQVGQLAVYGGEPEPQEEGGGGEVMNGGAGAGAGDGGKGGGGKNGKGGEEVEKVGEEDPKAMFASFLRRG